MRHRRNQRARASEKAGFYKPGTLVSRLRHAPKNFNRETWELIPLSSYGVGIVVRECENISDAPAFKNYPYIEVFWQGTGTREILHKKYVRAIPKVEHIVSYNVSASSDTK